jgi:hypothetical protein
MPPILDRDLLVPPKRHSRWSDIFFAVAPLAILSIAFLFVYSGTSPVQFAKSSLAAAGSVFTPTQSRASQLAREITDRISALWLPGKTLTYARQDRVSNGAEVTQLPPPAASASLPNSAQVLGTATTTIVNQYTTHPVTVRIIEQPAIPTPILGFVTAAQLDQKLSALDSSLRQLVFQNVSAPLSLPSSGGFANSIALTQRIDQLSGTSLSNITVSGVSGLTDSDIPDAITASNYLPLTGGTVSGDLTVSGTITGVASTSATIAQNAPTTNCQSDVAGSPQRWRTVLVAAEAPQ